MEIEVIEADVRAGGSPIEAALRRLGYAEVGLFGGTVSAWDNRKGIGGNWYLWTLQDDALRLEREVASARRPSARPNWPEPVEITIPRTVTLL